MERTLDIITEELERVREQRKPLYETVNALDKEIAKLENEMLAFKLNNGLYHPMSELINYKGKNLSSIKLVVRDEEGALDTDFIYCDEILEVDDNGHLYYSSYSGGIIEYDNDANQYIHLYYGTVEDYDYVGFLEINISKY
jgi:hypothetical protein